MLKVEKVVSTFPVNLKAKSVFPALRFSAHDQGHVKLFLDIKLGSKNTWIWTKDYLNSVKIPPVSFAVLISFSTKRSRNNILMH